MTHHHSNIIIPSGFTNEYSFEFDGNNEYFSVDNEADFDFEYNDPFSLSAWIKLTTGGFPTLFGKDTLGVSTPARGYLFYLNGNKLEAQLRHKGGVNRIHVNTSSSNVLSGSWQLVTMTYDGSGLASGVTFYINNSAQSSNVLQDDLASKTIVNDVKLGIASINGDVALGVYGGRINDSYVFNYELSSAQVTEIHHGGSTLNMNSYTGTSPIGWFRPQIANFASSVWTMTDQGSEGNDATSVSMGLADRVSDAP